MRSAGGPSGRLTCSPPPLAEASFIIWWTRRAWRAVEVCERFADGLAGEDEYKETRDQAQNAAEQRVPELTAIVGAAARATRRLCSGYKIGRACEIVPIIYGYEAAITAGVLSPHALWAEGIEIRKHPTFLNGEAIGERIQANLLREVIGNPFRPVTVDSGWLGWNDCTVQRVAQAIYDERAFDRLPLLADALEAAGCDNADILTHCRSGGEHVRGCWVVDLVLGKQ